MRVPRSLESVGTNFRLGSGVVELLLSWSKACFRTKIHYTELGPCQTKERGFGGMTRSQTAVSGGVSEHKMTREQNPTLNPVVLKIEKNRDVFLDIYSQFGTGLANAVLQ